jgi:hypothetical protein
MWLKGTASKLYSKDFQWLENETAAVNYAKDGGSGSIPHIVL